MEENRYMNNQFTDKKLKNEKTSSKGVHLIICVHGLGGSSWDFMHVKNFIDTLELDIVVHNATSIEENTSGGLNRRYRRNG